MAKKKTADKPAESPAPAPPIITAAAPPLSPAAPMGMPMAGMTGAMPMGMSAAGGMANPMMGGNPMMAMMQMMQMMMAGGGMAAPMVDPAALPFAAPAAALPETDRGLDADIIRPATLTQRVKSQLGLPIGSIFDHLCLTEDRQHSLGGVPKGCTIALAGPPGKGKTRSALAGLAHVARTGCPVGFVVAEEGFHNDEAVGRDDLCSRLVKVGMSVTGLPEKRFTAEVLDRLYVLQAQYHRHPSWDAFIQKYRFLVEKAQIRFVIIDSLNMLDPTKNRTADNLSALKTYNHEQGITCICIGQIRDTGMPVGGEALMHTADVVFLIEEMGLGSKETADFWGGKYRDKIDVVSAIKSVTTPVLPYPIRVDREPSTGILVPHALQPADYPVLPVA
ncbi:MAG TPA: ATPase domain-containing protein [Gemmatales bacterium]|nr:ATPase domain-containing protein [Gemmatales bacterium]HMP57914.1 ATPase domain-containing protein [Gemmatales bacterium]